MSDESNTDQVASDSPQAAQAEPATSPVDDAGTTVKRGGMIIATVIIATLTWYLVSDRFTPYTTQARIQGYVIGVAPKVAGEVTAVWAKNNQDVAQGERLFEVDRAQYEIALDKARSDLENARRQVDAGSAATDAARSNLDAARANRTRAEKDFNRLQRLHTEDPGTISTRRLEMSKASLDQAIAAVAAAESGVRQAIESMGGEDDANNAILQAASTAVDKAELDLSNTQVDAPSRGVITDLRADVGQFAGTGSPVMTLIAVHDLWISAEFTENNLGNMQTGDEVEILFDTIPGEIFDGRVRSIGIGIAAGQSHPPGTLPTIQNNRDFLRQAQRFPVVIDFAIANPALGGQLRIGGQASVTVYSRNAGLVAFLARFHIRLMSWLSYAY